MDRLFNRLAPQVRVLVWDERATLHRGTPWPYDQARTLVSCCVSAGNADGLSAVRP